MWIFNVKFDSKKKKVEGGRVVCYTAVFSVTSKYDIKQHSDAT